MISPSLTAEEFRQAEVNANQNASDKWAMCTSLNRLHLSHYYQFRDGSLICFIHDQYPRMVIKINKHSFILYRGR